MADIDSSEAFGSSVHNDHAFSQAKSFQTPYPSSSGADPAPAPTLESNLDSFSDFSSDLASESAQSSALEQQPSEPSDLVKFLYDLAPFLKPNPTDPEEMKMKKQQQVIRFQSLSQEMQQVALQKMQIWKHKQAQLAQEAAAKKAEQQQAHDATLTTPSGRRHGAQTAVSTDQLLDQMRNKSSDLTQAVG